ncbi:hypothetical protein GWK47_052966 [Chionoecetes opilio]|uniref:Uncharacterized protein n=1 Tax=Chionoecetes opilio TaxID=41210 RepID=A0A8J4Y5Y1_CHIOP|nr:hypothetical protein GWK47_052966 [Chionoecetes opilio]
MTSDPSVDTLKRPATKENKWWNMPFCSWERKSWSGEMLLPGLLTTPPVKRAPLTCSLQSLSSCRSSVRRLPLQQWSNMG